MCMNVCSHTQMQCLRMCEWRSLGPSHNSDGWAVCGGRYYLLCERVCVTGAEAGGCHTPAARPESPGELGEQLDALI